MGAGLSCVSAVRAANENSNSPHGLSDCLTSGGFDSGRVLGRRALRGVYANALHTRLGQVLN